MNLHDIITDIITTIDTYVNMKPICCYIGVGSAAHMVQNNILEDTYYHQYPKFLEDMNNSIDMTTFHILIDPMLESPPFMTIDKNKGLEFEQNALNKYTTTDMKHIVYTLKQSVTIQPYISHEGEVDITMELHLLNQIAINEHILLVYHDYSGRNIKHVATYFDPYIMEDLDHIVYGLGSRGDTGCYIDILDPASRFAFRTEDTIGRKAIRVFNIYHLYYNKLDIMEETDKYICHNNAIEYIDSMIYSVITNTMEHFNNIIFSKLRTVHQIITGKTSIDEISPYYIDNLFSGMVDKDKLILLFNTHQYKACFNKMLEVYSHDLDSIIYLKNIKSDRMELMQYIVSDPSEYKWSDTLKNILYDSY